MHLIAKKMWPHFKEGAYAVVFFNPEGRATKIFRRRHDVPCEHVKKIFNSEVRAYQIAQCNPKLRSLTPAFFGPVQVQHVVDANGNDISADFYLDLAYQMEKIAGDFVKIGSLSSENSIAIKQAFLSAGIEYTCDASVVIQDGNIVKVVDFAIGEYELEY